MRLYAATRFFLTCLLFCSRPLIAESAVTERYLYVSVPGVSRTQHEGGVAVFDINQGHRHVRFIPLPDVNRVTHPHGFKGICASAATQRLYLTYGPHITCLDLTTDKVLWTREYDSGCDRPAITPDGAKLYVPTGYWTKTPYWYVVDGETGDVLKKIPFSHRAHNTLTSQDGRYAYLACITSPYLAVVDTQTDQIIKKVGPFHDFIRPFTINGTATRCYVNTNDLLGFEIGDLTTGQKLHSVKVAGFTSGKRKLHKSAPSHGIGLTPDEKEIWIVDQFNRCLHLFDISSLPPKQVGHIELSFVPGWVTFSIDGRYAYPSTGDIIDTTTRKIIATLKDKDRQRIQSEKLIEIHFVNGQPVRVGDQFGVGRVIP